MWKLFQKEMYGRDVLEKDYGFVVYSKMKDSSVYIHNIYVMPDKRNAFRARKMMDEVVAITQTHSLASFVDLTTKNPELSIKAHLAYGMNILESSGDAIIFIKEISNGQK